MTRQDVLKTFPTATDDQISAILNMHHAEINGDKDTSSKLQTALSDLETARKEIEQLKTSGNDDLQAQIDKLTDANNKAQKTIKDMELKTSLLGKGFSAEDVDSYIKALDGDGDIADILGRMKDNAISAHDKDRLAKTPDPNGSGSTPPNTKDTASKIVEGMFGNSKNKNTDILSHYTM